MKKKILIDTDPGVDDALALILALKSNLDIQAISAVAGNVKLSQAHTNIKYLIDKLGSDIKPIPGANKPLEYKLVTTSVHGQNGLGSIEIEPKKTKSNISKIISEIIGKNITTIITLGPLTNIAKILKKSSKVKKQVKEIIIMGGAIDSPGNITPKAEFNIYVDPEAAKFVFNSKIKKTLIPLKVCHQVILKEEYFRKIKDKKTKELTLNLVSEYIKNNRKDDINGAPMYDPLTVYFALNRKAFTTKKYQIDIATKRVNRGRTKIDLKGSKVEVAVDIDEEQFKEDFLNTINKG